VAYYRVSDVKQGESGLGLEAQRASVARYLAGLKSSQLVGEYTEVESGKHHTNRPQLLAALALVQQMLADVATIARGLRLRAADCPAEDALAYAGPALCRATSACQQVVGAIGFTLEFPLQRAYRRARSLALWADAVLEGE